MAAEREIMKARKITNIFYFKDPQRSSGATLADIMD